MKAHSNNFTLREQQRRTRTITCARPGSEKVCQMVDFAVKSFTAGVPAAALLIATVWAVTLPGLDVFPQAAIWIKAVAILAAIPGAAWLYVTIAQLKEIGWA